MARIPCLGKQRLILEFGCELDEHGSRPVICFDRQIQALRRFATKFDRGFQRDYDILLPPEVRAGRLIFGRGSGLFRPAVPRLRSSATATDVPNAASRMTTR